MSAQLYTVPFQCVVVSGLAVPGATMTFYLTGTTTKTPIYTTSALSVEHPNPITANGAGAFSPIYLDSTITYRVVIKNAAGTTLTGGDIDPYIPGVTTLGITLTTATGSSVSTRAALAGIAGPVANQVAFLSEAGREGMFVFDSSNLSTPVAADTAQGVYVAPTTATSGASGAWVRQYDGPACVKWFGALGDNATDDSAAFQAAIDYLSDTYIYIAGYAFGAGRLFIPKGAYILGTTTIDVHAAIIIEGEGTWYGGGTVLHWAAGATGIRFHSSSGASSGSILRNLTLLGGYSAAAGAYHGVHLSTNVVIQDVYIDNFQGDAVHAYTTGVTGTIGDTEGAANLTRLDRVFAHGCLNGFYFKGADANACTITGCSAIGNREAGFYEDSYLGNYYFGCHANGNTTGAYLVNPAALNNASLIAGCYAESGQPASTFSPKTLVVGGLHAPGGTGGTVIQAAADAATFTGGATVSGPILSSAGGGSGYATGAGGTVTQATSKATGVTLNKACGQITTHNAALAANAIVSFLVSNSNVAAVDGVDVWLAAGFATAATYRVWLDGVSAGALRITIQNISAGSLSEALVIGFAVSKAATS